MNLLKTSEDQADI